MLTDSWVAFSRLRCGPVVGAGALALVDDLPAALAVVVGRVAGEGVLEAEPGLEPGREGERLERRAGSAAEARPVELAVEVVLPGVEAEQRPGLDVDARGGDVEVLQARRALRQHACLGRAHGLAGEGRLDAQPPGLDGVVVEALRMQLGLDHVEHEAALAGVLVRVLLLGQRGQLAVVAVLLGRVEVAHLDHAAEHVVVAADQRLPVRREVARRVEHGRQHRRLRDGQVLGRLGEVGLGGRLDAVGSAAEVDGVQVALEDLGLRLLLLDLEGEERLLDLAGEGALLVEVEDLDVLLGDRGRALGGVALGVGERRTKDALRVDAVVGVEGAVLRSDRGVLHRLGDLRERDRLAVLVGELPDLRLAARVVDVARLRLEGGVRVRDLGVLVGEVEDPHQHEDPREHGDREPAEDPLPAPGAADLGRLAGGGGWACRIAPGVVLAAHDTLFRLGSLVPGRHLPVERGYGPLPESSPGTG